MPADVDFTDTETARRNRAAKAATLAAYCRAHGIGPEIVAAEPADRRAICRAAGVRSASERTWFDVADLLIDDPPPPAAADPRSEPTSSTPATSTRSQTRPPGVGYCWHATDAGYCGRPAGGYTCDEHRAPVPVPPPGTTLADLMATRGRQLARHAGDTTDRTGWPICHACRTPVDPVVPLVDGRPEHMTCASDFDPPRRLRPPAATRRPPAARPDSTRARQPASVQA